MLYVLFSVFMFDYIDCYVYFNDFIVFEKTKLKKIQDCFFPGRHDV